MLQESEFKNVNTHFQNSCTTTSTSFFLGDLVLLNKTWKTPAEFNFFLLRPYMDAAR